MAAFFSSHRGERLRIALLRLAVILIGAGAIALLGLRIERVANGSIALVLTALVGVAALALSLRHGTAPRGLAAMVLCAGLVNFTSLPTGRESRVVISLAVAMVLLVVWLYQLMFGARTGVRFKPSQLNAPLLVFVAINVIAYAWSYLTRDALLRIWTSFPVVQVAALFVNIGLPMLALLVYNKIDDPVWIQRYIGFMVLLGALNMVARIFNIGFVMPFIENGTTGIFGTWVAVIAYGVLLYDKNASLPVKIALIVLLLAELFFYFWRQRIWLTGWLPIAVGALVMTYLRSKRLFALLCVLAGLYVVLNGDVLYSSVVQDNVDEGGLQRIDIWRMNLAHVANHPIFGMGPAGYAIYNMTYHAADARSTHNNYFDVLAQNGVLGLLSFFVMAGTVVWIGLRTRAAYAGVGDYREAFVNIALAGWIASLAAMMLGDWILPFAYNVTIMGFDHAMHAWLAIGGLLYLAHKAPARMSS
jgi:O-antigen ligase